MSTSYKVYIGPYIEAYRTLKSSVEKYYGCNNHKCMSFRKASSKGYCQDCGQKIELLTKMQAARVEFDVYTECSDNLYMLGANDLSEDKADYYIFISNTKAVGRDIDVCYSSGRVIEINTTTMDDDMAKFNSEFSGDILRIKELLGENNVAIKWGVVTYVC